jgi:hypothetical protein
MALSETQQISICQILQITPFALEYQIANLGSRLTAAMETAIQTEIDRWDDGAGAKFARVRPNLKNFGADVDPSDTKADIRSNIAVLLEMPEWGSSGAVEFSLSR